MIQMLRRILTLIGKEFAMVMRDPKSRFVVIGPPLIQFFVFGYAATYDLTNVSYAVLDESHSAQSRALLSRFEGNDHFTLVQTLMSEKQIAQVINPEKVRLVLHIPQDYAEKITKAEPAQVQVILDGRNSNVASIALGYVSTIISQENASIAVQSNRPLPQLVDRAWFNENMNSHWYILSALGGVISMVVVTTLTSLSVAREREFGTFDQLLVAPFGPTEILIGKAMPGLVFGLMDSLLLSLAAIFWFGVPMRGSVLALVAVLCLFVLAIVGVGLFISSLSMTMQQALLGSFVFIMPSVILGGFTTPIQNMPMWLQDMTLVNPLRYVVIALRQVFLQGAQITDVWPQLWPMALIAMLTLPLAGWMFRHRTG